MSLAKNATLSGTKKMNGYDAETQDLLSLLRPGEKFDSVAHYN